MVAVLAALEMELVSEVLVEARQLVAEVVVEVRDQQAVLVAMAALVRLFFFTQFLPPNLAEATAYWSDKERNKWIQQIQNLLFTKLYALNATTA